MTTQKRRVVYLSDEEWATLRKRSAEYEMTASAYVRALLVEGRIQRGRVVEEVRLRIADEPNPLRAIQRAEASFNSRGSRPAPKGKS